MVAPPTSLKNRIQMTSREAAEQELRRTQRRQRIALRRRRRKILNPAITLFCVVCIVASCAGVIGSELGEPERDARIAEFVEAQGGEVTKIVHPGRRGRGDGYVDVVFDGEQSRCTYDLLDQTPRSLKCDPAVNR